MTEVMKKAVELDDKTANEYEEKLQMLELENRGLKELLKIKTTYGVKEDIQNLLYMYIFFSYGNCFFIISLFKLYLFFLKKILKYLQIKNEYIQNLSVVYYFNKDDFKKILIF